MTLGARRKLSLSRNLPCDPCKGTGTKSGKKYECAVSGQLFMCAAVLCCPLRSMVQQLVPCGQCTRILWPVASLCTVPTNSYTTGVDAWSSSLMRLLSYATGRLGLSVDITTSCVRADMPWDRCPGADPPSGPRHGAADPGALLKLQRLRLRHSPR